jgi:hypothetical protein
MEEEAKPIPFIELSEAGEFEVNVDAMSLLQELSNKKVNIFAILLSFFLFNHFFTVFQISVVSIVGPYRSGKSFLGNYLLDQ